MVNADQYSTSPPPKKKKKEKRNCTGLSPCLLPWTHYRKFYPPKCHLKPYGARNCTRVAEATDVGAVMMHVDSTLFVYFNY